MNKQESKEIKVHLGCGYKKIPGFLNIDSRKEVRPDVISDICNIDDYIKSESVSLIYACHLLEHLNKEQTKIALGSWKKCLKPGGILRLSVPDFKSIVFYYNITKDMGGIQTLLFGGQKYDLDHHYICYDFNSLKKLLEENGFTNIVEYDWRKTEHSYIDDYSQAYIPHMDKVNGIQMSLNIEATNG